RCDPVPQEVRETADLLERRWQLSIIYAALTGALRFNEFADAVAGISPRMLSERLRDLERAGLVKRTVLPTSPPTVEYRLTARGRGRGRQAVHIRRAQCQVLCLRHRRVCVAAQ